MIHFWLSWLPANFFKRLEKILLLKFFFKEISSFHLIAVLLKILKDDSFKRYSDSSNIANPKLLISKGFFFIFLWRIFLVLQSLESCFIMSSDKFLCFSLFPYWNEKANSGHEKFSKYSPSTSIKKRLKQVLND